MSASVEMSERGLPLNPPIHLPSLGMNFAGKYVQVQIQVTPLGGKGDWKGPVH